MGVTRIRHMTMLTGAFGCTDEQGRTYVYAYQANQWVKCVSWTGPDDLQYDTEDPRLREIGRAWHAKAYPSRDEE